MNPNKANIVDFQVENIFPITIEAHRNPIGFTEESPRVALETQVIITGVSSWQVTLSGKVIFVTKPGKSSDLTCGKKLVDCGYDYHHGSGMASASAADRGLDDAIDCGPATDCRVGAHEDAAPRVREGHCARTPQGGA